LKGFRGEEAIDKDKKFWKQPSVTVSCDDVNTSIREGGGGISFPWRPRSEVPVWIWTAFYHTPNVLKILQLISKSETAALNEKQRIEPDRDIFEEQHHESDDAVEIAETAKKRSAPAIEIIDLSQEPKRKRKFSGIIDLTK
jgi:hypothetical protein